MKVLLCVLAIGVFANPAFAKSTEDYDVLAAVYGLFAQLDAGDPLNEEFYWLVNQESVQHAHHVLKTTVQHVDASSVKVAVSFEYQFLIPSEKASPARYLEQVIVFTKNALGLPDKVVSIQTLVDETDNFNSVFIPSKDQNLIRSLLYDWTYRINEPGQWSLNHLAPNPDTFTSAEPDVFGTDTYLQALKKLNYVSSRRTIQNLVIKPMDDAYLVSFEYIWHGQPQEGIEELARQSQKWKVEIQKDRAVVVEFEEKYLTPVTDLGAEIRC
mgnify:FL=1